MAIEDEIQDFHQLYKNYSDLKDNIESEIIAHATEANLVVLSQFNFELAKFDVKLRLALAVEDIGLNPFFVNEKQGDLKSCHLMLYKLADIWFAYESYIKLYSFNGSSKNKITWLSSNVHQNYIEDGNIRNALTRVNEELLNFFNTDNKRTALKDYIMYCSEEATGTMKGRLEEIYHAMDPMQDLQTYNHIQIISMAYSIRNNFTHNGEVTIYPENFNYALKNEYLKILYKYLVVVTIASTIITIQKQI